MTILDSNDDSVPGLYQAQAGIQLGQGLIAAYIQRGQGKLAARQADINARYAEMSAERALRKGDSEANKIRKRGSKILGAQKQSFAARNVRVDSSVVMDIQDETKSLIAEDVEDVKTNAWLQAFGFKQEGIESRYKANLAKIQSGVLAGIGTIATGATNAAITYEKGKLWKKRFGTQKAVSDANNS